MRHRRRDLERIAEALLCAETKPRDLAQAASDLHECLSSLVGRIADPEGGAASGTSLPNGLAISPAAAAMCIHDPMRTAVFLRGADAALNHALNRFPSETIEVVYAGTGPLAALVMPLLPRFRDAPIRFTFIDIHADAVEATRFLAGHFGVARSIASFVAGDATEYEHPDGRRLHGLITETMQSALSREPQVAIMRQLARQLVPGGFMVPECVRVDLVLGEPDWTRESRDERDQEGLELVQTLFELRAGVEQLPLDSAGCLPPVHVTIPRGDPNRQALYATTIVAYREHVLAPGQSGLTMPRVVAELENLQPRALEVRYRVGPEPGFVWSPY